MPTLPSPGFGLLNIDKPTGMTSHDVVAIVRRGTGVQKVGHAGTLDPLATGVLVLCLGQATRLSEYVMAHPKVYEARIHLGIETDTYDAEGQVIAQSPMQVVRQQVEAILPRFEGQLQQMPPMYSAIKQDGQPLYKKARRGEVVERAARRVTIERLALTEWAFPQFVVQVCCSPGTYIRSLAHDLGQALGVGAHLAGLRRLASGEHFRIEDAVPLDVLRQAMAEGAWRRYLISPDAALMGFPKVILSAEQSLAVHHGAGIELAGSGEGLCRAYDPADELVALLEPHPRYPGRWKPVKVFCS
jgi:tRNA pseudouridine55 synthase